VICNPFCKRIACSRTYDTHPGTGLDCTEKGAGLLTSRRSAIFASIPITTSPEHSITRSWTSVRKCISGEFLPRHGEDNQSNLALAGEAAIVAMTREARTACPGLALSPALEENHGGRRYHFY
jgi:hypothetical protein